MSTESNQRIAVIVCSWHHGNTRRVAEAIAARLGADLFTVEEALRTDLSSYELIGYGSGIYFARHDRKLLELVRALPVVPARAFIFSTAGNTMLWRWYHGSLRRALVQRGVSIAGEFNCPGWDTVGPFALFGGFYRGHPNQKDLARARAFAETLL